MSEGLHLSLAPPFVFICQQALRGSSLLKLSTDCQYRYLFSGFYRCTPRVQRKGGKIDSTVPSLLSFCHPETCLVNVPSESIGLRDGGVRGVAGVQE